MDKSKSYDYVKDVQSCGALIQNFMLAAYNDGKGTCWIGEVLEWKVKVSEILIKEQKELELMAIVTIGYPLIISRKRNREAVESFLLSR